MYKNYKINNINLNLHLQKHYLPQKCVFLGIKKIYDTTKQDSTQYFLFSKKNDLMFDHPSVTPITHIQWLAAACNSTPTR